MSLNFIHRYIPATHTPETAPTLLLLHGTGGDEYDMLPIGTMLAEQAGKGEAVNLLSPRGKVSEFGAARFFRRLAEGVFDVEDMKAQAADLRDFITSAADEYHFDAGKVIAVGYSNGANIAGALLVLYPALLKAAVQLRPMIPFAPPADWSLPQTPVFISSGALDPTVGLDHSQRWAALLTQAGARVSCHALRAGHQLSNEDIEKAVAWFTENHYI
jgi:predicted esterase